MVKFTRLFRLSDREGRLALCSTSNHERSVFAWCSPPNVLEAETPLASGVSSAGRWMLTARLFPRPRCLSAWALDALGVAFTPSLMLAWCVVCAGLLRVGVRSRGGTGDSLIVASIVRRTDGLAWL